MIYSGRLVHSGSIVAPRLPGDVRCSEDCDQLCELFSKILWNVDSEQNNYVA